ncbi:tetratricopeptide repeat protein [Brevibacillus fulvus]|uniref:Tetratricopeptide (TPR) repeat protein n=1 Tax=Brevibacillus fulvus TaxID=1125967 RepID=A0A938XUU6_9BACL|nr:tetratricopeptide repeat protein [Brevibacillus fulvus]MBM7588504.1 tetratricopeptide (TPR) repeat protein [Brevibacillus fulvus]
MSEEYITFTNEHGHAVQMPRADYEEKIIPYNLERFWDDRESLRQFAVDLVRDKFTAHAATAADRLLELYGPIESALIFRAVVYMQAGKWDKAKKKIREAIERYPDSDTGYLNLARIFAYEGDHLRALETLEQVLSKDPNHETGLKLYVENCLKLEKNEELLDKLQQWGEKESAWRPQLTIGRLAMQEGNLLQAMQFFSQALERTVEREAALLAVTGELGQAGYVYQLIQMCEKYWLPTFAQPYIAFNYANALLVTDQKAKALAILRECQQHLPEEKKEMVDQFIERIPGANEQPVMTEQPAAADGEAKKAWWKIWK